MTGTRLGRRVLEHLALELTAPDEQVLHFLLEVRYATSAQLRDLVFHGKRTAGAAMRATNRVMAKLRGVGLVTAMDRRIGGVRAGSGSFVWTLTEGGARLVGGAAGKRPARPREPSRTFLEHHLAATEAVVRLHAAARRDGLELVRVEAEPECWRRYTAAHGAAAYLKPDLAVTTATKRFDDHWFFEIDMDTEPPSRIVRKCRQYETYRRAGLEQRRLGVFPAVVWIVPSEARRSQLLEHFTEADIDLRVFTAITLDELEALVTDGFEHFINQTGGQKGGRP